MPLFHALLAAPFPPPPPFPEPEPILLLQWVHRVSMPLCSPIAAPPSPPAATISRRLFLLHSAPVCQETSLLSPSAWMSLLRRTGAAMWTTGPVDPAPCGIHGPLETSSASIGQTGASTGALSSAGSAGSFLQTRLVLTARPVQLMWPGIVQAANSDRDISRFSSETFSSAAGPSQLQQMKKGLPVCSLNRNLEMFGGV